MLILRAALYLFLAAVMAIGADAALGQNYPNRLIRIVTSDTGGPADFLTRLVAQELSARVGQQVIVENRAGSPVIVVQTVTKTPPDGYTLLMYSDSIWILPFMQDVPYDQLADLAPISLAANAPNVLVVHPSLPVKSVKELIALAKARPGALNYSMAVAGSSTQTAPELLKALAGINIVGVPYKGAAASLNAVLAGETQVAFPVVSSVMPYFNTSILRPLAVTTLQPTPLAPGVPTMAASGFPGFEAGLVFAFLAPAGTPAPIIDRANQEIVSILSKPDVKDKLYKLGMESGGSTPAQLAAAMKAQMAKWGKLIKEAHLRPPENR